MHFIYNGISYQHAGQPSDNYYDLELNPLIYNPCDDILEKSKLLFGLREKLLHSDAQKLQNVLSKGLIREFEMYFNQIPESDLAYWALFDYVSLSEFDTNFTKFQLNEEGNELILSNSTITLYLPLPILNIVGEDSNGDVCQIDENNFNQFNELYYSDVNIDPELFMSDEQIEKNEHSLKEYYDEIVSIFTKLPTCLIAF